MMDANNTHARHTQHNVRSNLILCCFDATGALIKGKLPLHLLVSKRRLRCACVCVVARARVLVRARVCVRAWEWARANVWVPSLSTYRVDAVFVLCLQAHGQCGLDELLPSCHVSAKCVARQVLGQHRLSAEASTPN